MIMIIFRDSMLLSSVLIWILVMKTYGNPDADPVIINQEMNVPIDKEVDVPVRKLCGEDCKTHEECIDPESICDELTKTCMCGTVNPEMSTTTQVPEATEAIPRKLCDEDCKTHEECIDPESICDELTKTCMCGTVNPEMSTTTQVPEATEAIQLPSGYQRLGPGIFLSFVNSTANWDTANANCKNVDQGKTQLVVIDSAEKNEAVAKISPAGTFPWIGLRQIDHWEYEWADGSTLTVQNGRLFNDGTDGQGYQNWRLTMNIDPDGRDNKDCIYMVVDQEKWDDWLCINPGVGYVCQYIP